MNTTYCGICNDWEEFKQTGKHVFQCQGCYCDHLSSYDNIEDYCEKSLEAVDL